MMNRNSILLRRKNKVIIPRGNALLPASDIATINKNLEGLGYTLSTEVIDALATLTVDEAARFYDEVIEALKQLRGVKGYRPMYPNFPRQVMEASHAELYINAVLHYLTTWVSDVVGDEKRRRVAAPLRERGTRASL